MNIDDVVKLDDEKLLELYWSLLDSEKRREEASKHAKFQTMEFPPTNPEFIKLKNKVKAELDNRKLKAEKNESPSA